MCGLCRCLDVKYQHSYTALTHYEILCTDTSYVLLLFSFMSFTRNRFIDCPLCSFIYQIIHFIFNSIIHFVLIKSCVLLIYSFIYLFIYLFIPLFVYLFIYLFVYLFIYLFIYLIIFSVHIIIHLIFDAIINLVTRSIIHSVIKSSNYFLFYFIDKYFEQKDLELYEPVRSRVDLDPLFLRVEDHFSSFLKNAPAIY